MTPLSVFTNIQRKRTKMCVVCHREYQASVPNQLMCSVTCRTVRKLKGKNNHVRSSKTAQDAERAIIKQALQMVNQTPPAMPLQERLKEERRGLEARIIVLDRLILAADKDPELQDLLELLG